MNERLIAALGQAEPGHLPRVNAQQPTRLMRAMQRRPGDAKYASLPALPPYGEQKHAESFGATGNNFQGAFQDDAFQNDAFQVF